jgi:glycerol-3-phosphate dehydrogenase
MGEAKSTAEVIVLGAGINGCGIALELAGVGKKVLVLERNTIGCGTSSKSSRLVHGGLRYLERFQLKLVREALQDRQELLETYPDLVKLKSFYLPVYHTSPRPAWMIWAGLKLYDRLAGKHSAHRSSIVPRSFFAEHTPCLTHHGLKAVFHYFDAKTDDLGLTRRIANDAGKRGARFLEHVLIRSIDRNRDFFTIDTDRGTFQAPVLVNATGPWIDEVNQTYRLPAQYHIRKISGVHIVIEGLLSQDLLFMQTRSKRIFFIIPETERNHTLIGTTEREETVPVDQVTVQTEDIRYLIDNINVYLKPPYQLTVNDVSDAFIGVRPLIAHNENPTDLSREYRLDFHRLGNSKLIHVFGGKLTTFLSLARKVRKRLT